MVQYAHYDSPFGPFLIGWENHVIISIRHTDLTSVPHEPSLVSDLANVQLQEYFAGTRQKFTFPMKLKGTAFQIAVWNELARIPYGQTRTYKDIACAIGNEKAVRAVGMACNRNPIWIAVPCHRVIGSNRKLTGYAGSLAMKDALLKLEDQYK